MPRDTRWTKAARDLLLRKGRTLLALSGLGVGLWGVASVAVALAILAPDLRRNYRDTEPPSIVLNTGPVSAEERRELERVPGVEAIESRPVVQGRIEVRPGLRLPIRLFAVEDFERLRVARFSPESGAWPPPPGTLLMERDGESLTGILEAMRERSGHGTGGDEEDGDPHRGGTAHAPPPSLTEPDQVRLRLTGAPAEVVAIRGTVFDPGQAPSRMERMIYGYATRETVAEWLGRPLDERLLATVTVDPTDRPAVVAVARRLEAALEGAGTPVERWSVLRYEHPHEFQMVAVLTLLGSLAGLALLLATVLVVHLIGALLANQVRQIGVIKALGGTTRQIAVTYLGAMAFLGLAAGAVAIPLGSRSGQAAAAAVSAFLNFEVLTERPSPWLYVALVALAAAVPLLAAAIPIVRTARRPAVEAFARQGVESLEAPRATRLLRATRGAGRGLRLPLALTLALRNASRHPRRLATTVLALFLGTTAFLTAVNLRESLLETADVVEQSKRHDTALYLGDSLERPDLLEWIASRPNVDRVETWTLTSASLLAPGELPDGSSASLYVVPANTRALAPTILAGSWLDPAEPDGLVVSQRVLEDRPGLALGEPCRLVVDDAEMEVRLVGVVKEFGPSVLYLQEELFDRRVGRSGLGNVVLVSLDDRSWSSRRALNGYLEKVTAHSDLDVERVLTPTIVALIIRGHLDVLALTLSFVALSMMLVSGLGVGSSLAVSVAERSREIGVLRAIGGRPVTIRTLLAYEAVLAALLAWGLAAALTVPVSRFAVSGFGSLVVGYPFDYRTSAVGVAAALGVALAIALLASWGASRRATRQPVHEALAYE